jgi:4'-phosphopantetheinyl transferase
MNGWSVLSEPIPPLDEDVHVWAVALDDAGFDAALWRDRLSPEEQARAARFKFARDQKRFIIAHAALRDLIAGYLKMKAANLRFDEGSSGKPKLAPPFDKSGVKFNLSHSHETALVAVHHGSEIGVDIEFIRAEFEFHEVAGHFFTKREITALNALPPVLQRQAFYKCWTSKEAFLKAKGTGLSGKLDEVEITLAGQHAQVTASVAGWSLSELDPGGGYEAALVRQGGPVKISCYRWKAV